MRQRLLRLYDIVQCCVSKNGTAGSRQVVQTVSENESCESGMRVCLLICRWRLLQCLHGKVQRGHRGKKSRPNILERLSLVILSLCQSLSRSLSPRLPGRKNVCHNTICIGGDETHGKALRFFEQACTCGHVASCVRAISSTRDVIFSSAPFLIPTRP
jgi:hypothetical protein